MLKTIEPGTARVALTLTKLRATKAAPLPRATIVLTCDDCREQIATLSLTMTHLAQELFRLRKEHAKYRHQWQQVD